MIHHPLFYTNCESNMDVELYVYDLTRGMARSMSRQFLGFQIDGVWHTSLVFGNVEYFFGSGVQTCYPGATHHGRPMEVIKLGVTQLPLDTILDYLGSLKEIYTPESYDLFAHNCNNFTNDFAMFLVGKGIPEHITSLPKRVLDTPFGQMLRPQLEAGMRGVTQAPVPQRNVPQANGSHNTPNRPGQSTSKPSNVKSSPYGKVTNTVDLATLDKHIAGAANTATTIFFTSSTCAPCKIAYPTFDSLAEQYSHSLFVKIDIDSAREIASKYQIRATPTFMTFSRGTKQEEWTGADPRLLTANVERVVGLTFPAHPHQKLKVPSLQYGSMKPITYGRVPPMEKLMSKLGNAAKSSEFIAIRTFVEKRSIDPREAPLPDLQTISRSFTDKVLALPLEARFPAVDLLRCAMIDPRVGGFFAEESESTVGKLVQQVLDEPQCPHNLRLVTLHLACNVFASHLYTKELMQARSSLAPLLVQLVTSSLLDASHPTTRVAAASLASNLAVANYRCRREENREGLAESLQVELAASFVECLGTEESAEARKVLLSALGYLLFFAPADGEVVDLCKALDTKIVVSNIKEHIVLAKEVSSLL